MSEWKVYVARPTVFLPDPQATLAAKKALCREAGMAGHTPLGSAPQPALALALKIARRTEQVMEACTLLIAKDDAVVRAQAGRRHMHGLDKTRVRILERRLDRPE